MQFIKFGGHGDGVAAKRVLWVGTASKSYSDCSQSLVLVYLCIEAVSGGGAERNFRLFILVVIMKLFLYRGSTLHTKYITYIYTKTIKQCF